MSPADGAAPPPSPSPASPTTPSDDLTELPDLRERRAWTLDALDALAEARGSHARARGDSRFGTIYSIVIGVVIVLAMSGSLVAKVFAVGCHGPGCAQTPQGAAAVVVASAVALAAGGGLALAARAVGPMGLSGARRSWFGAAPGDRALAVRGPLAAVTGVSAFVGGLAGALSMAALGSGRPAPFLLLAGTLAGLTLGAAIVVLAALAQTPRVDGGRSVRRARWWSVGAGSLITLGVAALVAVLGPWSAVLLDALPGVAGPGTGRHGDTVAGTLLGVAAGAALLSVVGWLGVPARARRLSMTELQRGGDASQALTSSLLMLEGGAIAELGAVRTLARRGRFGSRRLRGHGLRPVVAADLRRLRRARTPVLAAVAAVPVPVVTGALFGRTAALIVTAVLAVVLAGGAASGLRWWTRSSALHRLLPARDPLVRAAYLVAPALVASTWLAVVGALLGLSVATTAALVIGTCAGVLRSAPQGSAGLAAGEVAMTPMGAIPVGLVRVLLRGPDVTLAVVFLAVVGVPESALALAVALLFAFLTRSGDSRP